LLHTSNKIIAPKPERNMKIHTKPIVALASGAVLLTGVVCQTAQAQLIPSWSTVADGGTLSPSVLADAIAQNTGPEALTVDFSVSQVLGAYQYTYTVNNPVGDVLLNNNGSPTTTPEIVDAFSVAFNTTLPGAYVLGSQAGGLFDQNNGVAGLNWAFAAVSPGSSSPVLSFDSDMPPTLGNANASDSNPPSPWASNPDGQQVPVPSTVPEPTTIALLAGGLLLLPLRSIKKA